MDIQCRTWDEAFLAFFNNWLIITFFAALFFCLLIFLLGKRYWWFTAPSRRIFIVGAGVYLVSVVVVVVWTYFGLGTLWYSSIPEAYLQCAERSFGARGFLGGRIGHDVPAISQRLLMAILLFASVALGAVGALVVSAGWRRWRGVSAKV